MLSHWKTFWAETINGISITEGGSSGSPLFNQDGQVVGDLTGGPPDNCQNPSYSLYGKVYFSWDQMGVGASQRLKPWLDPGNYGPEKWDGTYSGIAPSADFSADQTNLQTGEAVTFEDMSSGNPLEWEWTFEGGDPASYTGKTPPAISYNTPGRYDVSLVSSNTIGTNTRDSVEMIVVGAPAADFSASNTYLVSGDLVDFTDESEGDPVAWEWTFEGGTPETSTDQNPTGIEYGTQGSYNVTLVAENEYGTDTIVKEGYVVVDGPFVEFEADVTYILQGEGVTFTDLSINNPTSWSWKFFGGSPGSFNGQNPPAIIYNGIGTYDVKLSISNDLGNNFMTKVDYIVVGDVGIEEYSLEAAIKVYPNPSQGNFTLELGQNGLNGASVNVINARGEIIYDQQISHDNSEMSIDISNEPAGIYMVRIQTENSTINKKITLIK